MPTESTNKAKNKPKYLFYKKAGHKEEKYWKKHPHLKPKRAKETEKSQNKKTLLIGIKKDLE